MVGIKSDLLDKYVELRDDLNQQSDTAVIVEKSLKQSIAQIESDPENASTAAKQGELSKIASGDSDLSPREKAELFDDGSDDSDDETEELSESEIQKEITERIFGDYQ